MKTQMLPYGTWPSPITAASVAAQSVRLSSVTIEGEDIYWLESRPFESGRSVLVHRNRHGLLRDVTPAPFNVRSRVHEYGGGAYLVDRATVYFSHFPDQRIYRLRPGEAVPVAITPVADCFFADYAADRHRRRLVAVREDHTVAGREAVTTLVSITDAGDVQVIASGRDFYAAPRVSPDGASLSWLSWDHPRMPWDGTDLWVADFAADGSLGPARHIAGGPEESIYQPDWTPDGELVFASDRSGWWQLYGLPRGHDAGAGPRALVVDAPARSEFGRAHWNFATATWASAGTSRLVVSYARDGVWTLGTVDRLSGALRDLAIDRDPQEWLTAGEDAAIVVAASPSATPALVRVTLDEGRVDVLREAADSVIDPRYVSRPQAITCRTNDGQVTHAFYYAPHHPEVVAPAGERPPLVAISHGGPTAAASRALDMKIQFWTSRGFAVVDVNYGGSTGFGRGYRERLRGQWGLVDVDDMVSVAEYLVAERQADPARLIIRGGSAGGYTTLAALTFRSGLFTAGASYYGVSDLEVLARDTHKFEARYCDSLVGPYPEVATEYRARSPVHAVDQLACALIFFQGLEDRVVPPNQSELMAEAVRRKGLPVAYLAFEGEQHGFRKADNIVRSLEAELYFYGKVFGFVPADTIAPVAIANIGP